MNSIFTNNNKFFKTIVDKSDYWDFKIAQSSFGTTATDGLQTACLSSFIDTTIEGCVDAQKKVISGVNNANYLWDEAINKGVTLNNIGFTGVDNASWKDSSEQFASERLKYNKNTITNEQFIELYSKSKLTIEENDYRLKLTAVNGNNGLYDYSGVSFVDYPEGETDEEKINVAKLNGGFFQGTFRYGNGCGYSILPDRIGDGWCLEFCLMKKDFTDVSQTSLNKTHQGNKGTFFYIGTRAENKWWKYYNAEKELFDETGYVQPGEGQHNPENEKIAFETSSGSSLKDANMARIETDNGFIMFNRTNEGFTAKDYEEGDTVILHQRKNVDSPNLFQYVNKTKDGYTAKNVCELERDSKQVYNVLSDIYENALSFYITDTGAVGYKYFTLDCDCGSEDNVVTEFSKSGIIEEENWYVIDVRFLTNHNETGKVYGPSGRKKERMRMMFYVNGVLVLVSKWVPVLNLRQLDDDSEKQEGVPYCISIGGGTQGLCDVVYADYKMLPEYVLPIEKNFCGSFIGYFKSFKFYTCDKNYEEINRNVKYENADIELKYCWDAFGNITKDTTKGDTDEYTLEKLFGNIDGDE